MTTGIPTTSPGYTPFDTDRDPLTLPPERVASLKKSLVKYCDEGKVMVISNQEMEALLNMATAYRKPPAVFPPAADCNERW